VQVLFTRALDSEGLLDGIVGRAERLADPTTPDADQPILLAVSDNGPQMTSGSTREFMALHAIATHFGRPGVPTDQAPVESFFGHLKHEWPHLTRIADPGDLDRELAAVRRSYNAVRLHAGIGYVTPNDEHAGRGPAIRHARRIGLARARQTRLAYHRQQRPSHPA
jgi:putative transposase